MALTGTSLAPTIARSPGVFRLSDNWTVAFHINNNANQTLGYTPISTASVPGTVVDTGIATNNAAGYFICVYAVGDTIHVWQVTPNAAPAYGHFMLPWNATTHVMGAMVTTPRFGLGSGDGTQGMITGCWDSTAARHLIVVSYYSNYSGWSLYTGGFTDGNASTAPGATGIWAPATPVVAQNGNSYYGTPSAMKAIYDGSALFLMVQVGGVVYLYGVPSIDTNGIGGFPRADLPLQGVTPTTVDMTLDPTSNTIALYFSTSTSVNALVRNGSGAYSSVQVLATVAVEAGTVIDAATQANGDTYLLFSTLANLPSGEVAMLKKVSGVWGGLQYVQSGAGGFHSPQANYAQVGGVNYIDYVFNYGAASPYQLYTSAAAGGTAPTTPVNQAPANGGYSAGTIPVLYGAYGNATAGDDMSAVEWKVRRTSDSFIMWDSGKHSQVQHNGDAFFVIYNTNNNTGDPNYVAATPPAYGVQYAWSYRTWDTQLNAASAWSTETTFTNVHAPTATIVSLVSGGQTLSGAGSTVATATAVNAGSIAIAAGTGSRFAALSATTVDTGANADTVTIGSISGDTLYVGRLIDVVLRSGAGGPAAYWRLNETSGTSAADSSGNTRTGTYNATYATLNQTGTLANGDPALATNGSGPAMRYANATGLPSGNASRSLEFWFRLAGTATGVPVCYGTQANQQSFGMSILSATSLRFETWNGDFDYTVTNLSTTWHHAVLTWNGTQAQLYLDGVGLGLVTLTTLNTVLNANGLTVGSRPDSSQFFAGSVQHVAVFARVLSAAEVLAHYNLGLRENGTLAHTHAVGVAVSAVSTTVTIQGGSLFVNLQGAQAESHTIDATQTTFFQSDGTTVLYASPQTVITPVAGGVTIATPTMTPGLTNGGAFKVGVQVRDQATGIWSSYSPLWTMNAVFPAPNQPTIAVVADPVNALVTVTAGPGSGSGAAVTSYDYYYRKATYSGRGATLWIPLLLGTTRTSIVHASAPIAWPLEYAVVGHSSGGTATPATISSQVTLGEMFGRLGVRLSYMLDYTRNVAFGALNSWEAGTNLAKAQNRTRQRFQGRAKSVLIGDLQDEWIMPGRSYSVFADEGSGYTIWVVWDKVADLDSLMGPFLLREPNGNNYVVGQMSLTWTQNEVNVWTVTCDWGEIDYPTSEIVV